MSHGEWPLDEGRQSYHRGASCCGRRAVPRGPARTFPSFSRALRDRAHGS
ncbi:Hypothetical protein A7982_06922 [Minicystis rosea]|nr:Hypothetical protein A7982_06922 [Minicystis rosea]